jgi:hypothetical protein
MSSNDRTWPMRVRFHQREREATEIPFEAFWDTHGFALVDGAGREHHFGLPEHSRDSVVFTWVATYTTDGRDDWAGHAHEAVHQGDFELADPTLGPAVSPLVDVALEHVVDYCAHKGFAFSPERETAVRTFAALHHASEPFDPAETYVYGAINGFTRVKDAEALRDYAQRAIDGRTSKSVTGKTIRLDNATAERMISHWRKTVAEREASAER